MNGDVRRSTNGGDSWTPLPGLVSLVTERGRYRFSVDDVAAMRRFPNISTISICPYNNSRVLIGTRQSGAFFSFDGGDNWTRVSGSGPIVYATSILWLAGCSGAYLSTYARGIYRIDMALHTQTVYPPPGPCDAVICRLRDSVLKQENLYRLLTKSGPIRGLIVSDGYVTAIKRGGKETRVAVTPGSVVTYFRGKPAGVSVVTTNTLPRPGRHIQAAFFAGRRVVVLRSPTPLRLFPIAQGKLGKGRAAPPRSTGATIEIESDVMINGNAFSVPEPDGPIVVKGVLQREFSQGLELRIDGRPAGTIAPGAKSFEVTIEPDGLGLGHHTAQLTAPCGCARPAIVAVAFFIISNGDEEEGKGSPRPSAPPTPPPTSPPPAAPSTKLAEIGLTETTVQGGETVKGTVTLTGAAPAGGASVSLASSDQGVATVPTSVLVPAGAGNAEFEVSTKSLGSPMTVSISASYAGATRTIDLTVTPVPVAKFEPALKASYDEKADVLTVNGSGWDPCGNEVELMLEAKGGTVKLGSVTPGSSGKFEREFGKTGAQDGDEVHGVQTTCATKQTIDAHDQL